MPHLVIALIEVWSSGPLKIPRPWTHSYSVPERFTPCRTVCCPPASRSSFPDTCNSGAAAARLPPDTTIQVVTTRRATKHTPSQDAGRIWAFKKYVPYVPEVHCMRLVEATVRAVACRSSKSTESEDARCPRRQDQHVYGRPADTKGEVWRFPRLWCASGTKMMQCRGRVATLQSAGQLTFDNAAQSAEPGAS
jgi:hypothetical protein